MRRAVAEYTVLGIRTTLPFFDRVLRHPDFVAGDFDTGFVGRFMAEPAPRRRTSVVGGRGGGGRGARPARARRPPASSRRAGRRRDSAWRARAWRDLGGRDGDLRRDRRRPRACASRCARGRTAATPCALDGREVEVDVRDAGPHAMSLLVDGRCARGRHRARAREATGSPLRGDVLDVGAGRGRARARPRPGAPPAAPRACRRPMPGKLVRVLVSAGRGGGGGPGARRHGSHEDGERDPRAARRAGSRRRPCAKARRWRRAPSSSCWSEPPSARPAPP